MAISQLSWACSHYDVIVTSYLTSYSDVILEWLVLILVSMERGCPYLYTGSKFRVIWPSVLIIQRGFLQKICLGKTLRITRVNTFYLLNFCQINKLAVLTSILDLLSEMAGRIRLSTSSLLDPAYAKPNLRNKTNKSNMAHFWYRCHDFKREWLFNVSYSMSIVKAILAFKANWLHRSILRYEQLMLAQAWKMTHLSFLRFLFFYKP